MTIKQIPGKLKFRFEIKSLIKVTLDEFTAQSGHHSHSGLCAATYTHTYSSCGGGLRNHSSSVCVVYITAAVTPSRCCCFDYHWLFTDGFICPTTWMYVSAACRTCINFSWKLVSDQSCGFQIKSLSLISHMYDCDCESVIKIMYNALNVFF